MAAENPTMGQSDTGHLARRFMNLPVTDRRAIIEDLLGWQAWPDMVFHGQWTDLLRQVHDRGLVGRLAEAVDARR